MEVKHLSYKESGRLLHEFSVLEQSNPRKIGTDWKNNANYIWIIEKALREGENDKGIGFLSYSIYPIADSKKSFIYIVKIHILEKYRGESATLIDGKRARQILFNEIEKIEDEHSKLDIDIITLVAKNDRLDRFYKEDLGFNDLPKGKVSEEYRSKTGCSEPILYRIKEKSKDRLMLSDDEKIFFGKIS